MYPLNMPAPWPRNQWYVAGFSTDIDTGIVARTFLEQPVVMFRDSAGKAHALSGICPHRMMPLELGKLKEDRLVCGYHGLEFALDGACVAAPTSSSIPDCALDAFPLREVGPLLWIWMGDPAFAEATPLPDQGAIGIGSDGYLTQCVDYCELKARYSLLIDNLFDLSHLGFVHASIVGEGGIALAPPRIEEREGRLIVERTLRDGPTDDYHRLLHPSMGDRMTIRLETDMIGISLINAGGPAFDGKDETSPLLGHQNFIHAITPATRTDTHYWIMLSRDYRIDDVELSTALASLEIAVVQQDKEVLEAIEQLLRSTPTLPVEISMPPDNGAMRARLRLIQMIRAEASA